MNLKKIISYIFGGLFISIAVIALTQDMYSKIIGIIFLFISVLFYPIFEYLCKITNRDFSIGRKIGLGLGTLFIPLLGIGKDVENDTVTISTLIISVIIILIFWFIMFKTNKNRYVDVDKRMILNESSENNIFARIYNHFTKKRNQEVFNEIEKENKVINYFKKLNVFTTNAIANMVSETLQKYNNLPDNEIPEIDISKVVMTFCKDLSEVNDEYGLNAKFNSDYYRNVLQKDMKPVYDRLVQCISRTLYERPSMERMRFVTETLNIIYDGMPTYASIKFYHNVTSEASKLEKYSNYSLERLSFEYKDLLIYAIDLLATCTCIAKMIFVEEKVKLLDENSDFYKIVSNMSKELNDLSIITKKTRTIYDEFYRSELGFINDELLYDIAIAIIYNNTTEKAISSTDKKILNINSDDAKITTFEKYERNMLDWLFSVSKDYRNLEIDRYIVYRTLNIIDLSNLSLYFKSLGCKKEYVKLYNVYVTRNNKMSDKERYLKGDFEKEKQEQLEKYSLNNISTGTQFELYLSNLFKELNYKTKHNGKAGDQGADLILKKNDMIYVVQAKYYSGKLSNTPVQEIVGAMKYYNANQGVVITNSSFTSGAEELAKANNVILIDGKDLKKLVDYVFDDNHDDDVLQKFAK